MVVDAKGEQAAQKPAGDPAKGDGQEQGQETAFTFKSAEEFNAALTKRLKPLTKTIEKLEGVIAELKGAKPEETDDPATEPQKGGKGDGASKPDPEFAKLRKEHERMKAELEAERTKARASRTKQAVKEAAIAAGFTDTADVVYNQFRDSATLGEDDEVRIGEKSVADALREFAATPTGKRLLPPKEAVGTGARPGTGGGGAGAGAKPGERPKDFENKAVKAMLAGQV